MNSTKLNICIALLLVIITILVLGIPSKEGNIGKLPNNTSLNQWDLNDINDILQRNGFGTVDAGDANGLMTNTIIFFTSLKSPNTVKFTKDAVTPIYGDWPKLNDGICARDDGYRSIRDLKGQPNMFDGLPGIGYAPISYDKKLEVINDASLSKIQKDAVTEFLKFKIFRDAVYDTASKATPKWYIPESVSNELSKRGHEMDRLSSMAFYDRVTEEQRHAASYEMCKSYAKNQGASVFGLQYGTWCLVGNTNDIALGTAPAPHRVYPTYGKCGPYQRFGGAWMNNLYSKPYKTSQSLYKLDSNQLSSALKILKSNGYSRMEDVIKAYMKDSDIY